MTSPSSTLPPLVASPSRGSGTVSPRDGGYKRVGHTRRNLPAPSAFSLVGWGVAEADEPAADLDEQHDEAIDLADQLVEAFSHPPASNQAENRLHMPRKGRLA